MPNSVPPSGITAAVESFVGIRIRLPTGDTFVARKPLLFEDAIRWQELLEQYQAGAAFSTSLKIILTEIRENLDVEDFSVVKKLTLAETIDWVVYSFFSHRRSVPDWMVQLVKQSQGQPNLTPPATSTPTPSPST